MPKNVTSLPTSEIKPKAELERKTRRVFTAEFKLAILQQADQCKHGELGALLRKHKLYSNQLAQWRNEYAVQGVKGLSKSKPGPAANKTAEQKRIEKLEKQIAQLKKKVELKDKCIDLQKKVLGMIEQIEHENQS